MSGAVKGRIKQYIKDRAVSAYHRVQAWERGPWYKYTQKWEMELSGRLTAEEKRRLNGEAFAKAHGYPIHWDDPKTFSEKIMWGMLYYQNPLRVRCNDKFTVKGYVEEVLGPGHTIPTYGWWTDPDDIDFAALPQRFVLKVDWYGGGRCNLYVPDKSGMDEKAVRERLREWMRPDHNIYYLSFRWDAQFSGPVIYAEEYLTPEDGCVHPHDYKFCCYHGVCKDMFVSADMGDTYYRNWFDRDFNAIPVSTGDVAAPWEIKKPRHYDEMLAMAEKLAAPFPFMRIDMYEAGDRLLVGEMTFAYGSGLVRVQPVSEDIQWGGYMDMPELDFDRLRENEPLPAETAYLLDEKIAPAATRRYMERKAFTALFYYPDLKTPRTLNEKQLWTALHWDSPLVSVLADRYEMKRYVAQTVGEQYVVPDIGVYTDTDQIDWEGLPERFAARSTANCGPDYRYLVRHKSCDSEGIFKATAGDWLLPWNTFYYQNACLPGRRVRPRIMIEKLLGGEKRLDEYRFYCAGGEVKLFCAVREQATARESCTFSDPESGEVLPVRVSGLHKRPQAPRPEKWADMLSVCARLSKDLPLVRIDFFETEGRVYVNRMSCDAGLFQRLEPVEQDRALGSGSLCPGGTRRKDKPERSRRRAHATSHLYFSTLYRGTKGSRMGTVFTYF